MFLADVSGPARVVCSPVEYSLGVGLEVSTKKIDLLKLTLPTGHALFGIAYSSLLKNLIEAHSANHDEVKVSEL